MSNIDKHIDEILNHTCYECGSKNVRYDLSPHCVYCTCLDCNKAQPPRFYTDDLEMTRTKEIYKRIKELEKVKC